MPGEGGRTLRLVLLAAATAALLEGSATAQTPARFSLDSAVGVDLVRGQNTTDRPNIIIDVTAVARLSDGWMLYVRPWFRQPRTTEWDTEIYQAALQYTRPGRVATRVDLGYIASPIGLGMADTRPGVNPTIGGHASYFSAMPAFDTGTPRVTPIASTYPLGATVTMSATKWDARGALVRTAPTRAFKVGSETNPDRAPAFEAGAGFTPRTGLRLGLSAAHGIYATAEEIASPARSDRSVTMVNLEGEYAFGHMKFAGEVTRSAYETTTGSDHAYAWFIQGTQTLTPRWFAAGRQEGTSAPTAISGVMRGTRPAMHNSEATIGYRLTTDFTLRGSFLARKPFTRSDWDQQVGVSLVWARRWW